MTDELRCVKCGKKLGEELNGRVKIVCPRCKTFNSFHYIPELVAFRAESLTKQSISDTSIVV